MITNNHCISCINLTKSLLNEILQSCGYSNTACLVSSMGSIFVLGDTEDFEIIEVDEHHEQYIITDAGNVKRTILFHGEVSDYGVLISMNGVATTTTGVTVEDDDDDEFKEFVKYDTGVLGQECTGTHSVQETIDNEEDEELH